MNRIPVLLCGNAKVFDGMVICTLSIVKYHTGPIDLFLFTMDLRERDPVFAPVTETARLFSSSEYGARLKTTGRFTSICGKT